MGKRKDPRPWILPCPHCGKEPIRELRNEWDDWGRFIDRTYYRITCCEVETMWHGDKKHAILQWNNAASRRSAI